jgi:succinate dehydrogenase / fumarate reductase cytochrome b subunit
LLYKIVTLQKKDVKIDFLDNIYCIAKIMTEKPLTPNTAVLHKNRPLSPHLSIYRLQLTSGLSILHRITGAYLYFGLILLAWTIFVMTYYPYVLVELGESIYGNAFTAILFKMMMFSWVLALFYHQLNGIRHLFWDAGKGFEIKTVYITGKIVVALSLILTIICWVLI